MSDTDLRDSPLQDDINFSDNDDDLNTTQTKKSVVPDDDVDEVTSSPALKRSKSPDAESDHADDDDFDEDRLLRDDDEDEEGDNSDANDDEEKDSEEEEENLKRSSKSLKLKRKRKEGKGKKKGSKRGTNFFLDEADVADSEDEEEEEYERGPANEVVLDKDELAAIQAVERRHESSKKMFSQSAEEIARGFEARHRAEAQLKKQYAARGGDPLQNIGNPQVSQQSFLPSVLDPKIFKVKCKPGNELVLVRAIFLKTIDVRNRGGLLKIKSAFCSDSKGFIYIEAVSEAFAKEIIMGLRMLYGNSFEQIPVPEMTSVLTVTIKKKPLKINQWVRLKRGPLKGDLARIVDLFEGGSKAFVQAVPRPDYSSNESGGSELFKKKAANGTTKLRPQPRLFDAEEAKANNGTVLRRHHPLSNGTHPFDVWNNEYYRDGFLFKEVTVATYIDEMNVNPRLEELQLFQPRKSKRDEYDDEEPDEDESTTAGGAANGSFIKDLAEQIQHMGEEESQEAVNPFMPGDLVQVTSGDLRNLVARITAVNDMSRVATIVPYNNELKTSFAVEVDLLVKYIFPGAHVKVVAGRYMGQTGRVVSVNPIDGDFVAAILTDGINTEIQCNVSSLQMSSEVATGHGNLMGYELYDLVTLSENESALVIVVGAEKLRVINHMGNIKEVNPQEVQGKRNAQSIRSSGFDAQQNTIGVSDTVTVTSGAHAKLTGTIKHMFKGTLWLHSNSYLKNSGIFVVKQRNCVVAGGKSATPVLSASYRGVLLPTPVHSTAGSGATPSHQSTPVSMQNRSPSGTPNGGGYKVGRDPAIGTTVRITKGAYKGLLAQVVDVTPTHFSVELLAKFKKIVIERNKTMPVGDKAGSFVSERRTVAVAGSLDAPSTPFLTSQTPTHFSGSETPRFQLGNETPMYGNETPGSRTPRGAGESEDSIWRVNANDAQPIIEPSPVSMTSSTPLSMQSGSRADPWAQQSQHGSATASRSGPMDMYSPLDASVYSTTNTPMSLGDSHYSRSSQNVSSSSALSFRDWTENLVAMVKRGNNTGKQVVIQHKADENGIVEVSFRDRFGNVDRSTLRLHYEDLVLAEPPKKELAMVLSGKYKGVTGVVRAHAGNDIVVVVSGKQEIYKQSILGWVNQPLSQQPQY